MPARKTILASGEIYHIYNRSINSMLLFQEKREFDRFVQTIKFYLQESPPSRFSYFLLHPKKYQINLKQSLVTLIAFCLMPNHYHFIIRQEKKDGIRKFIHRLSSSYSRYYNLKYKRKGSVFESKFKAIRVEDQNQLIHLTRYIHLNPVTSYICEDPEKYNYSSYRKYIKIDNNALDFVNPQDVLGDFIGEEYKKFVLNQKDYQRELAQIKRLITD